MKKIIFNNNQIEYDTGKATLIRVPNSKKKIWIPNRYIWPYGNRLSATLVEDFKYHTAGKGIMSADEIATKFGANIIEVAIHRPEKLEAQHIEADDNLKR